MKWLTKLAIASIVGGIKVLLIIGSLIVSALVFFHVIDSHSKVAKLAESYVENQTGLDVETIQETIEELK